MITVVKGNLFHAPKDELIVHACNCEGVWGAGIAADFRALYPEYYKAYKRHCQSFGHSLAGTALLLQGLKHPVGCLFTSTGFGFTVQSRNEIIANTLNSLIDLLQQTPHTKVINMPQINAGLFRVPWKLTEEVLKEFPEREFRVWIPQSK
jgi:ADP-ribose 1''-phosphate phosphatase